MNKIHSHQNQHLVSVLMPSLNQARFIEEALESILAQDYKRIEIVIQDGGSTDGTVEKLNKLYSKDPRVRWQSVPDSGPAAALNSAFSRSRGTIIGWLNADDRYCIGAVKRAVDALKSRAYLLTYGRGELVDEQGENPQPYPIKLPDVGLAGFHSGCFVCQPTVFFKRVLFRSLGPFNENFKTSFDFEYWLRLFSRFPDRITYIGDLQAQTRMHKNTITNQQYKDVIIEGISLSKKFLGVPSPHWATAYIETIMRKKPNSREEFDLFLKEIESFYSTDVINKFKKHFLMMT